MILSDISIGRPVLATVMNLLIVLVGVVAWERLPVREYPNIDRPVVTVETRYQGANAEIIESQITTPLEDSLSGIEGIDFIVSVSRAESSQITVTFRPERDADAAASDMRDRAGRVRDELPDEADAPVVAKVEADAQPIIWMALASDRHAADVVSDAADRLVKDRVQTLPGVASVRIFGQRRYAMRIWLDPLKLAAFGMTPADVEDAIRRQNLEIPSGRVESRDREFTVLAETDLRTVEEFQRIVLRRSDEHLVRLSDVARVELGAEDERSLARFRGESAVALGLVKQSVANPLALSAALRELLPDIQASLPEGMDLSIAYDSSIFIERSIDEVFKAILEAVVLVVLVIFLFLRSVRATMIPLVTIPVSLIGAFIFMYWMGFTVNTLTLLAMVLAIGMVVDDAIVMLENIYRHIEEGMPPMQAAYQGSREIAFAVLAMTLTLAAVFTPIAFTEGNTGKLFIEFALTLAGAVLVSGFVALTLSPMMCSRMLRHEQHGAFYELGEQLLDRMTGAYQKLLAAVLRLRWLLMLVAAGVVVVLVLLFRSLPSELAPIEDRGVLIGFGIAPEGSTIEYVDRYARQAEALYADIPEVERYFMAVGFPTSTQFISFVGLKPWEERDRKQQQIAMELMPKMFGIPGIMGFPINRPSLGQSFISRPVEFVLQTTGSYDDLQQTVGAVQGAAWAWGGLQNIDVDLKLNKPELKVDVHRDKAAAMGVPIADIGRTLETMLSGRDVTRFRIDAEQYDVIVQIEDRLRTDPADLRSIHVRGEGGAMIPLSNLVSVREAVSPKELNHFNKLRAAKFTANLAPGVSLDEALKFMEDTTKKVAPAEVQIDYGGVSREFRESSNTLYFTFLLALAFIYLVLAAQFESFLDPLIILFSVPLALAGALLALKLTGGTLNIYSQIGLITLIGLITKHGILIVEFSNQLQRKGRSIGEAVVEASSLRLRPILMTTGAMVLGALPLALADGAGAESRQQIGWVIVGGMLFGTLLTLFVVPVVYSLIARRHAPLPGAEGQDAPAV